MSDGRVSVTGIGDEDQGGAKEARVMLERAEVQAGVDVSKYENCLRSSDRS